MIRTGAAALAALILTAACAPTPSPLPRMIGELRPELMTADRVDARPGDAVTIEWSADTVRGVAYRLGRVAEDGDLVTRGVIP